MLRRFYTAQVFILLLIGACSQGGEVENVSSAGYPEGAVVRAYEEIPGRVKVEVFNGEKLIGEGDYQNESPDGAWTDYDAKTGLVTQITNFLRGRKQGVSLTFNGSTGHLKTKAFYQQDVLHGQYLVFDSRRKVEEKNYVLGELEGVVRKFYKDGKVLEEASYKNGKIHGTSRWYDAEGNLTIQYEYDEGKFVKDSTPKASSEDSAD